MIEKILVNIAELYYPKGISSSFQYDEYMQTTEFKKLKETLNALFNDKDIGSVSGLLLSEFRNNQIIKDIDENSRDSFDRCLTFKVEIIKKDVLYQLCMNISLLVPYYLVYVLKNKISLEPYKWLTNPLRDKYSEKELFNEELSFISGITEKVTSYKRFPEQLINKVIPTLTYADVEFGEFTFLNAFFLDDIKL